MNDQIVCHFCGDPITKMSGQEPDSILMHHISYEPEEIVPVHKSCHTTYHCKIDSRPLVQTLISITETQKKWLEDSCLNFSKWVRKKINEEMENGD